MFQKIHFRTQTIVLPSTCMLNTKVFSHKWTTQNGKRCWHEFKYAEKNFPFIRHHKWNFFCSFSRSLFVAISAVFYRCRFLYSRIIRSCRHLNFLYIMSRSHTLTNDEVFNSGPRVSHAKLRDNLTSRNVLLQFQFKSIRNENFQSFFLSFLIQLLLLFMRWKRQKHNRHLRKRAASG